MLHQIIKITKNSTRVGRGISAGKGKTAGRGTKGQKSRKSRGAPLFFEGGQTKLFARLPKIKGEKNSVKPKHLIAVSSKTINSKFSTGERVDIASLATKKIIKRQYPKRTEVKIIGVDKLKEGLDVSACRLTSCHNPKA